MLYFVLNYAYFSSMSRLQDCIFEHVDNMMLTSCLENSTSAVTMSWSDRDTKNGPVDPHGTKLNFGWSPASDPIWYTLPSPKPLSCLEPWRERR